MRIEGFIFGHYDSRGGGTFLEGTDEMAARRKYVEMGQGFAQTMEDAANWSKDENAAGFWGELHALRDDEEAALKFLTDEDFISRATLESYRDIREGEDLEWIDERILDEKEWGMARAFEDGLQWATDEVQETTPNPFMELLWWHEERKLLKLCPEGVHPGTDAEMGTTYFPPKPIEPGWKRSSFGEDACGLVLIL
jgi:hypothetical protein